MLFRYFLLALTVSSVFSALTLTCPDGEYLDSTSNPSYCNSCMKNCLACISATTCTKCQDRYFLYSAGSSC